MTTSALVPLQKSWAGNQLEADLKQLTVDLYTSMLKPMADRINVYGAPYLGDTPLIQQCIQQDGLTILNSGVDTTTKYIFKAWRYRNPKRGLHFARLYLKSLYGSNFNLSQMYQQIGGTYPNNLASAQDLVTYGYDPASYFLTSRVQVDLDTGGTVPSALVNVLRTTLAARFVVTVRVAKFMSEVAGTYNYMGAAQICRTAGAAAPVQTLFSETGNFAQRFGSANVAYLAGAR
jgi:hypothetical protein